MIYFGEWMNVSVVRGGALLLPYSSFLALMQEKKQKKIKASAEAEEDDGVHEGDRKRTEKNFPAPVGTFP